MPTVTTLIGSAVFIVGCVTTTSPADALPQDERFERVFLSIDTNRNDSISPEEFKASARTSAFNSTFDEIDQNQDGSISREELLNRFRRDALDLEITTALRRADKNQDGMINRQEYERYRPGERASRIFAVLDQNGDGNLDRNELRRALEQRARGNANPTPSQAGEPSSVEQNAPRASAIPPGMPKTVLKDQSYDSLPGVDPRLMSLDLYAATGEGPHPIMVMVHGGAWARGDKTGRGVISPKAAWFSDRGWLFASVNYRLSPAVSHPEHANDVAQAIAWLVENAESFQGDPDRIFLMGHSAGAHIVSAVACDPRHLEQAGLAPDVIKGTIPLDTAAYDVSRTGLNEIRRAMYERAFGTPVDGENPWPHATPITYIARPGAKEEIAPFLLIVSSLPERAVALRNTQAFAASLRNAGISVEMIAVEKSHAGCNEDVGRPGDPLTIAIDNFLESQMQALQGGVNSSTADKNAVSSAP